MLLTGGPAASVDVTVLQWSLTTSNDLATGTDACYKLTHVYGCLHSGVCPNL